MIGQQRIKITITLLLGVMAAHLSCAQEQPAAEPEQVEPNTAENAVMYDSTRYQLIVDREPFGTEPIDVDDEKEDDAALDALEKEYRLCFLLDDGEGNVRAGFQKKKVSKGDPKSVMLRVGESYGTLKLLGIDLENSSAQLMYRGSEVTFDLEKPTVAAKPAAPTPPNRPQRRFGGGFRRTTPEPEPEPEPEPAAPQLTAEELAVQREQIQQNLREYQMEVIRQGMPPLPVQLTPEQDDQLVAEGVLPPLEEEAQ